MLSQQSPHRDCRRATGRGFADVLLKSLEFEPLRKQSLLNLGCEGGTVTAEHDTIPLLVRWYDTRDGVDDPLDLSLDDLRSDTFQNGLTERLSILSHQSGQSRLGKSPGTASAIRRI